MDTIMAAGSDPPVSQKGEMAWAEREPWLLERIRSGDRQAAEDLVEDTYRPLYASLVRLCGGDRDLAADLTQETFRRAWQALATFDGRSRTLTWLYRIAYNAFLNQRRRPLHVVPLEENAPAPEDPSPTAEEAIARAESFRGLREAVLALPDEQRFVVTARYWACLPVAEIAREAGISRVAIHKRLRRALATLEQTLERSTS